MDVFLIMAFHIGKVFAVGALPTEIVQVGLAIKKILPAICLQRSGQTFLDAYKTVGHGDEVKDPDGRSVCSATTIPFLEYMFSNMFWVKLVFV